MHYHAIENQQNSIARWLLDGDQCTKIFYARMTTTRNKNHIKQLTDSRGYCITNSIDLQNTSISDSSSLYHSKLIINSFPNIPCKKVLTGQARVKRGTEITAEEIKQATFHIDDDRSPDPDVFRAKYFKHH